MNIINNMKIFYIILLYFCNINYAYSDDHTTLEKIEYYFNNLGNIQAKFSQLNTDGTIQKGRVFISMPHRMRWQYEYPERFIIIANYSTLIHYSYDLDEITHMPISSTFLKKFCQKVFKIPPPFKTEDSSNKLSVTFIDASLNSKPEITITLTPNPLMLESITVNDNSRGNIKIFFYDIKIIDSIPEETFQIDRRN